MSGFHKLDLKKPDGRNLTLYSLRPLSTSIVPTNPIHEPIDNQPHLRWHPLREEWVAYASHRQNRTFLPSKEENPLAPTKNPEAPTELPAGDYDIAVFDNLFASLTLQSNESPESIVPTRPASGHCEVVVFTQDPETSLAALSVDHIALLLKVWGDRYLEISQKGDLKYIMPFENRGVEVGVTLHHPHGQIYSYPVLPPVPARMLKSQKDFYDGNQGKALIRHLMEKEIQDGRRVIVNNPHTIAFVPAFARYPYEVWISPLRTYENPSQMTDEETLDFAKTLKTVLLKYDQLWDRPFPYLMVLYAAPCDGKRYPEWHFHVQFSPPLRQKNKLKYLAGTELGAGLFINDGLPEMAAEELKKVEVKL